MTKQLTKIMFSDVSTWDVKRYLTALIYSEFNIVTLGSYIREESEKVKPFEKPNESFYILGVSNRVGLFDNDVRQGSEINQQYKIVENGFLAFNPYRINVGSIGIKTEVQKHNLISPAYVVFSCNTKHIEPDFLFLVMKTPSFNRVIKASTKGSVRQILSFDILSGLKIPLPAIQIQRGLIKRYRDHLKYSVSLEEKIHLVNKEYEQLIINMLDIRIAKKTDDSSLITFISFKDIGRWDYQMNSFDFKNVSSKYSFVKIKTLIQESQYGSSRKADENVLDTPILRMGNIVNGELELSSLKYLKLDQKEKESRILNKGDVLFNRTNSKELVGKLAVFNIDGEYTFASYLIRLKLDVKLILPEYFTMILNSFIGRRQIDAVSRQITGQVNINVDELGNFRIPLPSISEQIIIVKNLTSLKERSKYYQFESKELVKMALKEFQESIFNET